MANIVINLTLPAPGERPEIQKKKPKSCSVEEKIRGIIDLVESDRESSQEWKTLRRFYDSLTKMKQTSRVKNLREIIKPVLSKYGYHVE